MPRSVHVTVQETERVRAGDPLIVRSWGPIDPHDVLPDAFPITRSCLLVAGLWRQQPRQTPQRVAQLS